MQTDSNPIRQTGDNPDQVTWEEARRLLRYVTVEWEPHQESETEAQETLERWARLLAKPPEAVASAAEMFASCLKDLGRARLIGTRTAGAVLGSHIERLPNGDGFQYAAANYISQKTGASLEGVGVPPDLEVIPSRKCLLAGHDPPLEAAIRWIHDQAAEGDSSRASR